MAEMLSLILKESVILFDNSLMEGSTIGSPLGQHFANIIVCWLNDRPKDFESSKVYYKKIWGWWFLFCWYLVLLCFLLIYSRNIEYINKKHSNIKFSIKLEINPNSFKEISHHHDNLYWQALLLFWAFHIG